MSDSRTREMDELAERIAAGETDEALELLHRLYPHATPWPAHVKRRIADRQAEGRAHG